MRLYYAVRIQQTGDVTWQSGPMGLWTLAEFTITIICGCMPVIPKFFQTVGPKIYSSSKGSSSLGPSKGSKISGTSAKRSGAGGSEGFLTDSNEAQRQPHGKYDSLDENELEMVAGKGSTFSSVSESIKPLPSSPGEKAMSQQQIVSEKKRSQILRTVRIETRRDDLERQQESDWWILKCVTVKAISYECLIVLLRLDHGRYHSWWSYRTECIF